MNRSLGMILLNISVALYLLATGVVGLAGKSLFKDSGEISKAVTSIFKGNVADIVIVILSILAVAAGVFILMKFFGVVIPITELFLVILAIVWVIFIILIDFAGGIADPNFIGWLGKLGLHLMVLSGILLATERFGG